MKNSAAEAQSVLDSFFQVIGDKGKTESEKVAEIGTIWKNNID